jgi:hypothetical protein
MRLRLGGAIGYIGNDGHFAMANYNRVRTGFDSLARGQSPRRYALGDNPNLDRKAVVR